MPKQRTASTKNAQPDPLNRESVLAAFRKTMRPLNLDALFRVLGQPRRTKKTLEAILADLAASGEILRLRGGFYGLMQQLKLVTGRLRVQRSGAGFVEPEHGGQSLYIPPASMGDAWHGDTVAVARVPGFRGGQGLNPEGRIARVLRRASSQIPMTALRFAGRQLMANPVDSRVNAHFLVEGADPVEVRSGGIILAAPGEKIDQGLWAARLVSVLGDEQTVAAQERLVKTSHGVPGEFPAEALEEAERLPASPTPEELRAQFKQGRADLLDVPFVTIDGADARDFDDAIHVSRTGAGFLLRVAIADVSYYVRPGSALDREARERGNSWYFPASVEPMLPPALSNGLCSLNPDEPRLVMVAELDFSAEGRREAARFFPACIQSKKRLIYEDVTALLANKATKPANIASPAPPGPIDAETAAMLRQAEALAALLRTRRRERGSLDFNVPEAVALVKGDAVAGIVAREAGISDSIIEECMVAANEAVASFLHGGNIPALYRVHPEPDPDKLEGLFESLRASGLAPAARRPNGKTLQTLLADDSRTQRQWIVRRLALRAMSQARYSPEMDRHFGLAAGFYCHFTSPIRRYADLTVHRSLRQALGLPVYGDLPDARRLERIAQELNNRERTATDAEREIVRRLSVLYLSGKIGEVYEGVITGLLDFGFFVECREVMVEGMVRLSTIGGDYFLFDPARQELLGQATGRVFRLGQPVRVRVADTSLSRLEINLTLADDSPGARRITRTSRAARPFRPKGSTRARRGPTSVLKTSPTAPKKRRP